MATIHEERNQASEHGTAHIDERSSALCSLEIESGQEENTFEGLDQSTSDNNGRWKAAKFVLANQCLTNLALYGVITNLVVYFTDILHQGNTTAANSVSTLGGTGSLFSLIGAFLGDAYWGRYWTSIIGSCVFLLGMGALVLSAWLPGLRPPKCPAGVDLVPNCEQASALQSGFFYFALYLMSLGVAAYQPCLTALGADQFDENDAEEKKEQSSFFNWFYMSVNVGALFAATLVVYVEESISWGVGFGISTAIAAISLLVLVYGTPSYRHRRAGGNPITRVAQVMVSTVRKWRMKVPTDSNDLYEVAEKYSLIKGSRKLSHTNTFRFLDKAATMTGSERQSTMITSPWRLCTVTQVEEVKFVLRVVPVLMCSIVFSTAYVQMSTLFVEQGGLMNRKVGRVTIPAASISTFDTVSVMIWVTLYDKVVVRKRTGKISNLQRMGVGLGVSILSMCAAAVVELARKRHPRGLSVFWQVPQYFLVGASEVFTYVGEMAFLYQEAPDGVKSLSSALFSVGSALGTYASAVLLTLVNRATRPAVWVPEHDLDAGHLDHFFWLLAGLSALNLAAYVWVARRYHA